ncbi:LytTR family DNA-binding domain-containing protein [Terrimonas sp. NA20]|uniref:LytTR family DNA-binding domain-containing protein n=1 Tax=Terrimonas ginsenosidimutans TaxID=2908004 RepID=A0ABS9KPW4_9BACT|nr:LytTR family DNA-binding domain-containing protein [Terrimonas ginsenosidimutans]MCG2614310.1 LytTR family DNA-binding domain-containing protein [Terrimonas ginsenosidimutans]
MINTILIIEDEKPNADRLLRLIRTIRPKAVVVAVLDSISDSVDWFRKNEHPDIVLMDVRLSDGLSFEIFEKTTINSPIIFTTAYDEYAVKAFKYNSVDYLLKPVEQEELAAAFEKFETIPSAVQQPAIEGLINYLQPKEYRGRFLLPFRDGYKTVLVSDIVFFYSELKITRAKLYNGADEILPQTMEELEQQLNPKQFFRANRQFIIHIDGVSQVHNYFNGKLKVEMKGNADTEIIVSRDKAHLLKGWMDY